MLVYSLSDIFWLLIVFICNAIVFYVGQSDMASAMIDAMGVSSFYYLIMVQIRQIYAFYKKKKMKEMEDGE